MTNQAPTGAITAFKGFDKNLQCRGFQYAVGETFTTDEKPKVCLQGFHACEYPLDAFVYYAPADSRYAPVFCEGDVDREDGGDTKIACARLTITAELRIPELVSRAVEWITARIDKALEQTNTGDWSAATNTGDQSAATNTGYQSAADVTGAHAVAASLGIQGRARACAGSAVVLCHRADDGALLHIRAGIAGRDGIKPDTWYRLDANGVIEEMA